MSSSIDLPLTGDIAVTPPPKFQGSLGAPFYLAINEISLDVAQYDYNQLGQSASLECSFTPAPSAVSITSLNILVVDGVGPTDNVYGQVSRLFIRRNGVLYFDSYHVATKPEVQRIWTLVNDPSTGLPWTTAGVTACSVGIELDGSIDPLAAVTVYQLLPQMIYVASPKQLEAQRMVASQRLRLRRSQISMIGIDLPLLRADSEILTDVAMSHRDLAWASPGQRGVNPWERAYLRVIRQAPDYLGLSTKLTGLDVRRYLTTLWDTLRSDEDPSSIYQGVARLNAGGGRTFTRTSNAWVPSPVAQARGVARVIRLLADAEKTLFDGTLIEEASTNQMLRSSAVSGATGYSDSGASGTWTTTTSTDPLFDSTITPNLIVGTAGSPHTADLVRQFPNTSSLPGAGYVAVQVDHKDDVGAPLGWKLQRLVDNQYWNAGTTSWQAGTVTNLMTVRPAWTTDPDRLGVIAYGASATVLRFSIVIPTGGTASRQNRIAHVQIGNERWYASRIVTDAAVVTGAADDVTYENNIGKRSHAAAQGSQRVNVIPSWNSADQATGQLFVVWEVYHDASNFEYLAYDTTAGAWVYVRRAAATTTTASKVATVTAGAMVRMGVRWCGAAGEWGLSPFTRSIFIEGVKGTDVVSAAAMAETSPSSLRVGRNNAGNRFRGRIYEIDFSPFVWSDDEFVDA